VKNRYMQRWRGLAPIHLANAAALALFRLANAAALALIRLTNAALQLPYGSGETRGVLLLRSQAER
jgi:hypothetical protein